jgi:hypothetical protein
MISYERILAEMERQLSVAKQARDESAIREALSAIRSLCEVTLTGEVKTEQRIVPKMLSVQSETQSLSTLEGTLLEEEDANGGSLFDF